MAYNNGNRATNQSLQKTAAPSNPVAELKTIANSPAMMNRFRQVIGEKAPQFLASVISAVSTNSQLVKANPTSIMASAMIAATLDLDINSSLGFAALVPYNRNTPIKDEQGNIIRWEKSTDAQFQIMTKGLVQLAIRSGQYRNINVTEVYADEFESVDIISGDLQMHPVSGGQRSRGETGMIVGYVAYLKLTSGFEKTVYWPLEKIIQHAARFSKSYDSKTGNFRKGSAWADNFEAMCRKTVLKNALSSWGILSIQMQTAIVSDQGVMKDFEQMDYPDGHEGDDLTPTTGKDVEGSSEPVEEPTLPPPAKQTKRKAATPVTPKKTIEEIEADAEMQGDDDSTLFMDDEEAELERLWGDQLMNIKKIILSDDQVKVDYSTDAGEYKINLSGDLASLDLTKSIARLANIFASRLKLDDLRHKPMTLPSGLDTGNDDSGDWYRVHGTYTANNITYKLQTGKMREMQYELSDDLDIDDYPYLLSVEELDLIEKTLEEATLFVDGKRKQDPQGELFEDLASKTVGAFDSLINDAKGQGATVIMGGVEL